MTIIVNGEPHNVVGGTLEALLEKLGFEDGAVATALNGQFVSASARDATDLNDGDTVEILAPMQGG